MRFPFFSVICIATQGLHDILQPAVAVVTPQKRMLSLVRPKARNWFSDRWRPVIMLVTLAFITPVSPSHAVTPSAKFAYVANQSSNSLSAYTINPATGALTAGIEVAAGTMPYSVTVDPSGRFAYVANRDSSDVSVYTINQSTGALTAGTTVAAGLWPTSVTVDPFGKFAYVATDIGSVIVYSIDQVTGALTVEDEVTAGSGSTSITVDPLGRFAYVANSASGDVSVYTINQSTGALTAGTTVAAGVYPNSVTVDPSGRFAYVANSGSNTVSVYTIDQGTGALTAGIDALTGPNPESVAVHPSGRFAYVANWGGYFVSVFTIDNSTGELTEQAGNVTLTGAYPVSVTVDPFGRFAYVANSGSDNVSVYTINQTTGALIDGTAVAAGLGPRSVATTGDSVPPVISQPLNFSTQISGTLPFSSSRPSTFECRLDNGVFAPCTSPFSYTNLVTGQHTLDVRATDIAGNISTSAVTWRIDTGRMASSAILLPQTGQTSCYDAAGTLLTSCAGTGQDGDKRAGIAWPSPRFIDKSVATPADLTIVDNLTGLIWAKDGNLAAIDLSWQEALDYIKTLNSSSYLGHSDWRLPNSNEIESLFNRQQADSVSLLSGVGFTNVQPNYWSGSTNAGYPNSVWYADMSSSSLTGNDKTYGTYSVLPVRSGQPGSVSLPKTGQTECYDNLGEIIYCTGTGQDGETQTGIALPNPRFIDNSLSTSADQTVSDNLTGLSWAKDGALALGTWQEALNYIKTLNSSSYLGYKDWRLPNNNELASLANRQQSDPSAWLNGQGFVNVQADRYWSGSSDAFNAVDAWSVSMSGSNMFSFTKTDYTFYVWPVRSGQSTSYAALTSQAVNFGPAPTIALGGAGTVVATATSGLAVSLTSTTPATCTISGSTVTSVTPGTCTIAANQPGNSFYNPAPQLTQSFTIFADKVSQTINVSVPLTILPGGTGTVSPRASSGLAVSLASATPVVCTVSGTIVTALAAGTCTVNADQAGNANFQAAPRMTRDIIVKVADAYVPKFAYVANGNSFTISVYSVDQITGAMTAMDPVVLGSFSPKSVAVDPYARFAYVAGGDSTTGEMVYSVIAFSINPTTGNLTAVNQLTGGSYLSSITVDPSGKFVYIASSYSDEILVFTINQVTGALTAGTTVTVSYPRSITADPSGRFVYVASMSGASVYTIDQVTGSLTAGTPVQVDQSSSLTVDPSGRFVYVTSQDQKIYVYKVDQASGDLIQVEEKAAGTYPYGIIVDPSGKFVYVINSTTNDVTAYTIDQLTGALTTGSTVTIPQGLGRKLAVDPSGKFVYLISSGNETVYTYSIDQTSGALTLTNTAATNWPYSIAISGSIAVLPTAPNIGTAAAGIGLAAVSFTPPVSDGGSTITNYTVTSTPGNHAATGAASPITVTGLTNGTAYSFTVTATNSVGTGNPSNPSNSVTPFKADQIVTFGTAPTVTVGATGTVSATATSGLGVSFSSTTPGVCTVSGSTVTGVSVGTCTIRASQEGDASYNAAPEVTQSLSVTTGNATLTITTAGTGSGTVNSSPTGIACESGISAGCSASFVNGTAVTLTAAPDWKSDFISWAIGCSGTGIACNLTLNGDSGVTATFSLKPLVKSPESTYFATIQDAYNASSGGIFKLRDQTFSEDLLFNLPISLSLYCGMNDTWNQAGYTALNGTLTIANGSVTISNLIIQ